MLTLNACFAILNLTPHASAEEVRRAYLTLAKQWHPDRHLPQDQTQAAEKFREVTAAYEQIKRHLEASPAVSQAVGLTVHTLSAEELYEAAACLAEQGQYTEAIAQLSLAIRINPDFAEAYRFRGYLNSLLGFEHRAAADLAKATALESDGTPASSPEPRSTSLEQEFAQVKAQAATRQTQKKLRVGAIAGCILAGVALCSTIRPSIEESVPLQPVVFELQQL